MSLPARDIFLDCLKGLAIATVVLGHTFQGATADFDHSLPFRLIYSFHMPMFMFVAGMTASLGFSKQLSTGMDFPAYVSEIRFKAHRLVLPFVTWALIKYVMIHPEGYTPATWLLHVFQVPDDGLWFLWALFQCSCVLVLVTAAIQHMMGAPAKTSPAGRHHSASLYLLLIPTWLISNALLRALPSDYGLGMAKAYFPYFFLGFAFHLIRPRGLPKSIRWIPYIVFTALAPFWYRTEISPVALIFPNAGLANLEFQRIVAVAGTLALVDFARLSTDYAPALLTRAVAYCGKRSLDIYAIHFFFLAYFPPVAAPIIASLGVSLILRTNALTSWLCLGQKPLKIWPTDQYRLSPNRAEIADNAIAMPKE